MTQIQKLSHSQHHHKKIQPQTNPNSSSSSMWNPRSTSSEDQSTWDSNKPPPEDDDSWEVRAFAEDTGNVMGTTWPPRSYTCTFCRREFRSAQALGGHMNVHRRDRARLHQTHHPATASPFINIPTQELVANAGLCLLYHFPSPNNFSLPNANANGESAPSSLVSVSPYSTNNLMMQSCTPTPSFGAASSGIINGTALSSYICNSSKVEREQPATPAVDNTRHEELDLELRLGHKPRPT